MLFRPLLLMFLSFLWGRGRQKMSVSKRERESVLAGRVYLSAQEERPTSCSSQLHHMKWLVGTATNQRGFAAASATNGSSRWRVFFFTVRSAFRPSNVKFNGLIDEGLSLARTEENVRLTNTNDIYQIKQIITQWESRVLWSQITNSIYIIIG